MENKILKNQVEQYYLNLKYQRINDKQKKYRLALQNEEFRILDDEIIDLRIENAKNQNKFAERLKQLEQKQKECLDKLNIDMQEKYFCAKCKDSGVLKDGSDCSCKKQKYADLLKSFADIASLPTFTFAQNEIENIKCAQSEKLNFLYGKMQQYCNTFETSKIKNIIMTGEVGTGKTCLISAIANDIAQKGYVVQYLTAFELSQLFLKHYTSKIEGRMPLFEGLMECDLLIIDDLATEPIYKNVSEVCLFNLINYRWSKQKVTIISSNLNRDELFARYGERTASRLTQKNTSLLIDLTGDNIRLIKK
ncbi:MAG: ATP-binding protein [Clostridia bacterium]